MCMSKPKVPDLPATPAPAPVVDETGEAEQQAMKKSKDKMAKSAAAAGGMQGTLLTGAGGLTETANVKRKTLLGE